MLLVRAEFPSREAAGTGSWALANQRRLKEDDGLGILATSLQVCLAIDITINCPPPPAPPPPDRCPLHDAVPHNRLPGRATSCPPGLAVAEARARSPGLRILPVPVRRGQGRQVRQQRLCWPDDDSCSGRKGRNALPAPARPDRGSCQLRFPGMRPIANCRAASIARTRSLRRALLTLNCITGHRAKVDAAHCPRIRASGSYPDRPPLAREPRPRGQVPPR